jgi:predicted nucleic acid-binding protein
VIGLDTNVIVRYLAQDGVKRTAVTNRLIEGSLSAESRDFISNVSLAEVEIDTLIESNAPAVLVTVDAHKHLANGDRDLHRWLENYGIEPAPRS